MIIVNEHEAADLARHLGIAARGADATVAALARRLGHTVIATLGPDGAIAATGTRGYPGPGARRSTPVDTTGAGDTFCGVLAAYLDEGADLSTAHAHGGDRRLAGGHEGRRAAELPDRAAINAAARTLIRNISRSAPTKARRCRPIAAGHQVRHMSNTLMKAAFKPARREPSHAERSTVVPLQGMSERGRNPRVLRLNPADNIIVAIDPILPGAIAEGVTAVEPRAEGAQDGDGGHRGRRGDPQVRPDHRFRQGFDPPRRIRPRAQLRRPRFRPRLSFRRSC